VPVDLLYDIPELVYAFEEELGQTEQVVVSINFTRVHCVVIDGDHLYILFKVERQITDYI
jgi:hypothetical protein